MASTAISPLQLSGSHFRFGKNLIPLNHAKFFHVNKDSLDLFCETGDYQTQFRFHFENEQNKQKCIRAFIQQTELQPYLLRFRNVVPYLAEKEESKESTISKQNEASIKFEFYDESSKTLFEQYFLPLFSDKGSVISSGGTTPSVTVQLPKIGSKETQIGRIQEIFKGVMKRFGSSGINEALLNLQDPRFPPIPAGSLVMDLKKRRQFDVNKEAIVETVLLPGHLSVEIPTEQAEIEQWLADPKPERVKEKHLVYLQEQMLQLLRNIPVDNYKLKPLMNAALSIPDFNLVEFMKKV